MIPGTGYVIVEIPEAISSIKTESGIQLFIDTSFNPEKFANVWGTVVEIPGLIKSENFLADRDKRHLISSDNDIRLKVGDKVYFHYLTIKNAKKSYNRGTYFEENVPLKDVEYWSDCSPMTDNKHKVFARSKDGKYHDTLEIPSMKEKHIAEGKERLQSRQPTINKRFAILPYSSLFFAVRKKQCIASMSDSFLKTEIEKGTNLFETEYIMLNDWVLIEPIRKGQHVEFIKGYGNAIIDDEATAGGMIKIISDTPYKASEGLVRACPPGCGLEVGERIIFEKESDVPVEYDLCRTLEQPYWRMKLEDIVARRTDTEFQMVRDYTLIVKDDAETETRSGFYIPEVTQKKPLRGKVVMVGPDVKEVLAGETVMFENFTYTEFPFEEGAGVLVREEKIQIKLN